MADCGRHGERKRCPLIYGATGVQLRLPSSTTFPRMGAATTAHPNRAKQSERAKKLKGKARSKLQPHQTLMRHGRVSESYSGDQWARQSCLPSLGCCTPEQ
ncbi:hypothetical protein MRX96_009295 [Rhipicephalus microplus]